MDCPPISNYNLGNLSRTRFQCKDRWVEAEYLKDSYIKWREGSLDDSDVDYTYRLPGVPYVALIHVANSVGIVSLASALNSISLALQQGPTRNIELSPLELIFVCIRLRDLESTNEAIRSAFIPNAISFARTLSNADKIVLNHEVVVDFS